MWTRIYLLLVLVRLYFALSPSYIHPDENFQGPEVIAGRIFGFPYHSTWEFDPAEPVRSAFSLWPVYGLPMTVLRWLWTESGHEKVAPKVIYYTTRGVMFMGSFVLEDWAIHELVHSPRQRRVAVILVASSYVTWTYQTHTFSNSVETLVVLWSLVLMQRILEHKQRSSVFAAGILGFLVVFGTFNRITFPAFIIFPGVYLLPHFSRKPFTLLAIALSAFLTTICALLIDHAFYNPNTPLATIFTTAPPPLRSLLYNLSTTNLSTHGLHPRYTHILINLPLLLGPVIPLLLSPPYSPHLISPVIATAILSLIPHQEPRFLLPVIPLLLSCTKLPTSRRWTRVFVGTWVCFNLLLAILMGVYHQGGVVPMQIWLGEHFNNQVPDRHANTPIEALHIHQRHPTGIDVLWWRTYSPPIWLLDGKAETTSTGAGIRTIDLMGIPFAQFIAKMEERTGSCDGETRDIIVVAPRSSTELDGFRDGKPEEWRWEEVWTEWRQLNLDDMDWAEDGVLGTVGRVVGRRGLGAWKVERICP